MSSTGSCHDRSRDHRGSRSGRVDEERYNSLSIWATFLAHLSTAGFTVPADVLERDVTASTAPSPGVQAVLSEIYRTRPDLTEMCESLTDLDEGLQEWCYRHVKMVQRTIGANIGSGGSLGVEYLQSTLFNPAFPDLWEIRTGF
ncbi:MAG TPA: tryptophan 2,3-dioxygenase family protein [Acidimicrobiales bacterium]|jgi:tryptophan 2,3-dioxygenase|nr:tryptophan 2,3-dioxygenase family protein [Acidimicrobiales bacterium]MDP7116980.1 tryptophan 2,3-dioxygenase family protein [Acidimicrobiales bacterium]MDP7410390.1 tryptophan 2,3-dioxygenase family protein [Acidimicrobiales bacterium]MEE1522282.1 tryptophan 2,3-dioxygenase family protein [Acidimicrobiales bacterium]MEE1570608.1 tryptophan 2,3-dioxygenase family protein [Acidimicrobiales bacterium]